MKRALVVTLATLALPMVLGAQQPTANKTTASFKAFSGRYGGWIMAAFDSIPAGKYDYKPTPAQLTVGRIARHLADANNQICAGFSGLKAPTEAKDSLPETAPKDSLVARLKGSFSFCDSAMEKVDDANLNDEMPAGPAGSGRTIPRSRYLIAFVVDLADHYSQIANYMRLSGLVPPSAAPRPNR